STNGNNSLLAWRMTNENNVLNYIVEKSIDGYNFVSAGSLNGLNTGSQNYSFTDANNANNPALYYRLKIISKTGSISYSNIVLLKFGAVKNQLTVYPNPAKGY